MKNRLQFNRCFTLFNSREEAKAWLENHISQPDFTPLIGEPIVLRYRDSEGKKQLILAVGKAVNRVPEYHIIDTAEIDENFTDVRGLLSNLSATTEAFSAITEETFATIFEDLRFLSGQTDFLSAGTIALSADTENTINALSGGTLQLSGDVVNYVNELSGGTIQLSADTKNTIDALSAATTAISATVKTLEDRTIEGFSAITITTDGGKKTISLKIADEDKVLTQDYFKGLQANLSLTYVSNERKIYLKGKNDTLISQIDATDFIKDGMLSSATIITATEQDHEQYPYLIVGEKYLKLIFNQDADYGPVFISVKDLVDIYTVSGGSTDYLTIDNYQVAVNVDTEHGLASKSYADTISTGLAYVSGITDNIISACGLNVGQEGTYPTPTDAHVIAGAGSLYNADLMLDNYVWGVSGSVNALSAETMAVIDNLPAQIDSAFTLAITSAGTMIETLSGDVISYVDETANVIEMNSPFEPGPFRYCRFRYNICDD